MPTLGTDAIQASKASLSGRVNKPCWFTKVNSGTPGIWTQRAIAWGERCVRFFCTPHCCPDFIPQELDQFPPFRPFGFLKLRHEGGSELLHPLWDTLFREQDFHRFFRRFWAHLFLFMLSLFGLKFFCAPAQLNHHGSRVLSTLRLFGAPHKSHIGLGPYNSDFKSLFRIKGI